MRVRVRCTVQCKASVVAKIDKRTARKLRLGRKAIRIASGRSTILKPGRQAFSIKLTSKAKKALKRKRMKRIPVRVSFKVTDLNGKQAYSKTKKATLR